MTFQAQVTIPYFTAIPEDVIQNVWHFEGQVGGGTDFAGLAGSLKGFYDAAYAGGTSGLQWAPWVSRASSKLKIYDLNDPKPRAPVYEANFVLAGSAATTAVDIPELALCVSYQGAPVSGVPQARRRGRIFLGGIGSTLTAGTTTTFPSLTNAILDGVGTAAANLISTVDVDGFDWVVYSRVSGLSAVVTNGWVDNAFDIQRRRGNAATSRRLWT